MNRIRRAYIAGAIFLAAAFVGGKNGGWRSVVFAQTKNTRQTVRHHKVAETDEFPQEIRNAEAAIDKKDYAAAEKFLAAFAAKDPNSYRVWFDLGYIYTAQDRTEDAIVAYRKAVAAKPDVFESNLNLGLLLARTNNPDAATSLRAATQLKPSSQPEVGLVRAWSSLAQVLESKSPEEAAAAYREALKLQPKDSGLHLALGAVLEQAKDEKSAESEYQQVLDLGSIGTASMGTASTSADAVTALANLYMRQKRFPLAEAMLRKLLASSPDATRPGAAAQHVQLGRVLAAEGKYEEAASELDAGIRLAPGDAAAVRDLADVYALNKRNAEAEALYRQLLTAKPDDAELRDALGKSLLDQHKFSEARSEFLKAVKLKPDFGSAYGNLAIAANENKDYPLVIRALDARAKFLPELPFGYFLRATAFDHLKDYKNASLNYHKFLDVADGKFPDQEWQARHRLITIEPKK
jgi:Flp pilus assembly protein TadD